MDKKQEFKEKIQELCEEYGYGIAMVPHVQKDGILITMDIVAAPNPAEEAVIKDITEEGNETPTKNSSTDDTSRATEV